MREFALAVCLALGVAAGSANADILTWTFKGTIYEVIAEGSGDDISVGDEITVTFYLDLDKLPPDDCSGDLYLACWRNLQDPTNPDNGYGSPGGSWITSEATVFNGTSTIVIPNTVAGGGESNYDMVEWRTDNDPDGLLVVDDAIGNGLWHYTSVLLYSDDDLFNDGVTPPSISTPFSIANASRGGIALSRVGSDVSVRLLATVTLATSSYAVPIPGTAALLALGLVPLSLARRYLKQAPGGN